MAYMIGGSAWITRVNTTFVYNIASDSDLYLYVLGHRGNALVCDYGDIKKEANVGTRYPFSFIPSISRPQSYFPLLTYCQKG